MGKLSFRYSMNPEPGHMNAFRYKYENLTEYGLAYQRYAALSDTSIFNSPVGITKIAAGLSDLCALFEVKNSASFEPSKEYEFASNNHSMDAKDNTDMDASSKSGHDIDNARNPENTLIYRENYRMDFCKDVYLQASTDHISFSILPMYFLEPVGDITVNYYENVFTSGYDLHMEIRQDILVSGETNHINILENITVSSPDPRKGMNIYENLYGKLPILEFLVFDDTFGWIPDPTGNILRQPAVYKELPIANINEIENSAREEYRGFLTNFLPIPQRELIANYPYRVLSSGITRYSSKFENVYMNISDKVVNKIEMEMCIRPFPATNIYDIILSSADDKTLYNNIFYSVSSDGNTGYTFNPDTFGIQETKYILRTEDIYGRQFDIHAFIEPDYDDFGNKASSNTPGFVFDDIDAGVIHQYAGTYEAVSVLKGGSEAAADSSELGVLRTPSDAFTSTTIVPFRKSKKGKPADGHSNGIMLSKDNTMLSYFQKGVFAIKTNAFAMENNAGLHLHKCAKDTFTQHEVVSGLKQAHDMYLNRNGLLMHKVSKDMGILYSGESIFKISHDFRLADNGYFIYRLPYDLMEIQKDIHMFKNPRGIWLMNGIWVSARRTFTNMDMGIMEDSMFVFRKVRPIQVANMIVPFSKINRKGLIDRINEMVYKAAHGTDWSLRQDMWASVIPKPVWTASDEAQLFIDKAPIKVFIDYQNHWMLKSKLKSIISGTLLGTDKVKKDIQFFRDDWVNKAKIGNKIYEPPLGSIKIPKDMHLFKDEWFDGNKIHDISGIYQMFEEEWLQKMPALGYYAYGLMADNFKRDIALFNDESAYREPKDMVMDFGSQVTRDPDIRIWMDEYIFTERGLKDFDIYESIEWLEKTRKKLGLHPNDIGNWAWVYETPDPIEPVFGMDELLLPENDTRYEDLKEIIFDKEKMRPRSPVKIINDTTFIARYPIKHPSKNHFADLAVDYDASAYRWENYYGIKTEIMHICFLKYYRIWETKMFEFSTMTMQQAVNQMLEYMYAWMIDYFPLDELEQAFRVLRLIRWYGETAIIQNSQYLISYEYGILESKLTSGTCLVPNNLDVNDTMFVDASMGVIRNNPAYIRNGSAYVEFYIDNKKNTTFTFSLSNSVGSVNIYINDELIDQRPFTVRNLTYPLDATGDTNVVRIEKPANHNLNDMFYIGNIKIPDCAFKDLSIEFDPKMRAGNKPLDVVAKKMIQFAQLHENRDEVYDMIFKANLGISEVYKKLMEYWELHHQDKTKGKRLTIKKC